MEGFKGLEAGLNFEFVQSHRAKNRLRLTDVVCVQGRLHSRTTKVVGDSLVNFPKSAIQYHVCAEVEAKPWATSTTRSCLDLRSHTNTGPRPGILRSFKVHLNLYPYRYLARKLRPRQPRTKSIVCDN